MILINYMSYQDFTTNAMCHHHPLFCISINLLYYLIGTNPHPSSTPPVFVYPVLLSNHCYNHNSLPSAPPPVPPSPRVILTASYLSPPPPPPLVLQTIIVCMFTIVCLNHRLTHRLLVHQVPFSITS